MGDGVARLLDRRIGEELGRHALVSLVGPAGAGKLDAALANAASADLLDTAEVVDAAGSATDDSALDGAGCVIRQGLAFVEGVGIDPSIALAGAEPHAIAHVECVPAVRKALVSYVRALGESGAVGSLITTSCVDSERALAKAAEERRAREAAVEERGVRAGAGEADVRAMAAAGAGDELEGSGDALVSEGSRERAAQVTLRMLPLSLQEQGVSSGVVSLEGLFSQELRPSEFAAGEDGGAGATFRGGVGKAILTSTDIAHMVCLGGWVAAAEAGDGRGAATEAADSDGLERTREQVRSLVERASVGTRLSREGIDGCVWALARCLGEVPTYAKIASGMEATTGVRPARDTVRSYLRELELHQVTLPVLGWMPPGRSRMRMRTKAKHYFVDPSVPAALLAKDAAELANDPQLLQALLANLVARDLHTYLEAIGGGRVCHYLDDNGLSADFVVERRRGSQLQWGAIRVCLTEATVDAAAHDLRRIAKKCRSVPPAFLAIITGRGNEAQALETDLFRVPLAQFGA